MHARGQEKREIQTGCRVRGMAVQVEPCGVRGLAVYLRSVKCLGSCVLKPMPPRGASGLDGSPWGDSCDSRLGVSTQMFDLAG